MKRVINDLLTACLVQPSAYFVSKVGLAPINNKRVKMMKKTVMLAAAATAAIAASPSQAAVTFVGVNGSGLTYAASLALADFTFENASTPAGFTRTGGEIRTSDSSTGALPAFDTSTGFLTVVNGAVSTIRAVSPAAYRNISLYAGSLDNLNLLELLDFNGSVLASYTGSQLAAPNEATGNQDIGQTNRFLTFTGTGNDVFGGVRFSSGIDSFEVDNVGFSVAAAVPEPATWAMMLLGFAMVGGAARYRRRNTIVAFA